MKLGMSFSRMARENTPRGVCHANRLRTPHQRQPSGKVKVIEGLDLVEWHLDNGNNGEAQRLMGLIKSGKVAA